MQIQKKYEILDGLPPYGSMYIPISESGEEFYNEGFVVRFFRNDGSNWIGNFKTGWTKYSDVFELPNTDKIIVIAYGQGYIMTTEEQRPFATLGIGIAKILRTDNNRFIAADQTDLTIIEADGIIWRTERISWDGFEDLTLKNNTVTGLSFGPMELNDTGVPFSFDLDTKELTGGSYPTFERRRQK